MAIGNRFLLNFAASYSGGGYKRLHAYAEWFNRNGGAWFAIHPRCSDLVAKFPNNGYFPIARSRLARIFNDWSYLHGIGETIGRPDLYYCYGIPLYVPFGRLNWFHLSNVLPLNTAGVPLSWQDRYKFQMLGRRIRSGLALADVISAESRSSLKLIPAHIGAKLVVSVNGADDELAAMADLDRVPKVDTAVVCGTYTYKAVEESSRVFERLRAQTAALKLLIIGDEQLIPAALRRDPNVISCGALPRAQVIEHLRSCRYYISTTHVENSYNAASEGIFLADESYISDIGPHRELLGTSPYKRVGFADIERPLLHVRRWDLCSAVLTPWDSVINEMLHTAASVEPAANLAQRGPGRDRYQAAVRARDSLT